MRGRRVALCLLGVLTALALTLPADAGVGRLSGELSAFAADGGEELAWIGERIARNETAGRPGHLIHWGVGEDHASLGIGHVIWYPAGRRGPFRESFPELLAFLAAQGVALPAWLTPETPCPWPDRAAFRAASADPRMIELRRLLAGTKAEQAAFLTLRLARALPEIESAAPAPARRVLGDRLERLLRAPDGGLSPAGVYALVDYVNFKGEGTLASERYLGVGWGLLQVLEAMPQEFEDAGTAFARAAATVLERRVTLAPAGGREERWLAGWLPRVATYAESGRLDPVSASDG